MKVVMAWVNPATISKRRWNYLFQQCLHRLEKRREMSLMDSRIKRREQQMKELNEIGLLLSSERDLKKQEMYVQNINYIKYTVYNT